MNLRCPHCSVPFVVPVGTTGVILCPACGTNCQVPGPPAQPLTVLPTPKRPEPRIDVPVTQSIRCYDCDRLVPEGQSVRVPMSKVCVRIPMTKAWWAATPEKVSLCPECAEVREEQHRRMNKAAWTVTKTYLITMVGCAVVSVLVSFGIIVFALWAASR